MGERGANGIPPFPEVLHVVNGGGRDISFIQPLVKYPFSCQQPLPHAALMSLTDIYTHPSQEREKRLSGEEKTGTIGGRVGQETLTRLV